MELIECISKAWGWTGIEPSEISGENAFGNLIVRDSSGLYWRLCPEDLSCQVIARGRSELDLLSKDQAFLHDWYMSSLVAEAEESLGPLSAGQKYCLRIPGPLGGEYGGSNLAKLALRELVLASGHIAEQIKDLPDGATVQLKIVD
jgi:hypothetical protein